MSPALLNSHAHSALRSRTINFYLQPSTSKLPSNKLLNPEVLPAPEVICVSGYFWHRRMHTALTTWLFDDFRGTETPERKHLWNIHAGISLCIYKYIYIYINFLICSLVVCPEELFWLQKRPLRFGCCDLRCTSIAFLSYCSRAV